MPVVSSPCRSTARGVMRPLSDGLPPPDELYLAVGGDSLANRAGDTYSADLVTYCETYYGSGNVTVENFSQGGLQTYATLNDNAAADGVYFWEDDTSAASPKLTGLIGDITTPEDVNAVVLFLGSNDQREAFEALYEGGTLTDAQYQTALTELCEYLYNTAFPNARFIMIQRLHRYDTTNFPNPKWFEAVKRNQQAVIDALSYVKALPDIWDVDLADATHPSQTAFENVIHHRLGDACAYYHGKTTAKSTTGPYISSAVRNNDHIIATITHDQGTDLTVPTNSDRGFRYNMDDDDDTEDNAVGAVTKVDSTSIKILTRNIGIGSGNDEKLYMTYERQNALSGTSAEAVVDNASSIICPIRQGPITVTEGDLLRQLSDVSWDINPAADVYTTSGSDVLTMTGYNGVGIQSASGRYGQITTAGFGGVPALYDPDGTTHYVTDTDMALSANCMLVFVLEFNGGAPASNTDFLCHAGGTSFGSNSAGFQMDTGADLIWGKNIGNGFEEVQADTATNNSGKCILIANFTEDAGTQNIDFYVNSTTVTHSLEPKDSYDDKDRFFFFSRTNSVGSYQNLRIARALRKSSAHGQSGEPTIAELMAYLNTQYSIGLSL